MRLLYIRRLHKRSHEHVSYLSFFQSYSHVSVEINPQMLDFQNFQAHVKWYKAGEGHFEGLS